MEKRDYEFIDPMNHEVYTDDPISDIPPVPVTEYVLDAANFSVEEFTELKAADLTLLKIVKDVFDAANFAVEEFNRLKGAELKLLKIVKVNASLVGGVLFYMTLECCEGCFYEVKVFKPIMEDPILKVFRPARHYPISNSSSNGSSSSKSNDSSEDRDSK